MGDSLTVDRWAETKPSIPVTCDLNNILFGATRRVLKSRSKWTWFFLQRFQCVTTTNWLTVKFFLPGTSSGDT